MAGILNVPFCKQCISLQLLLRLQLYYSPSSCRRSSTDTLYPLASESLLATHSCKDGQDAGPTSPPYYPCRAADDDLATSSAQNLLLWGLLSQGMPGLREYN